ncbi:hypothetical protein [Flaviflexus massiliensis]|uniref:hypothetical protein n=1 Tax=Flaviflexus massiliensis TaxID=1522309 RepID=UPI0011C8C2AB|nr:hypothetical protein [Flaviflexus massiliensis]
MNQSPVMGPGAPSYQQQTQGFASASSANTGAQLQPGQHQQSGQYGQNPAQMDHQPIQNPPQGYYSGPGPYQYNPAGYDAPPKKNTKLWVILGSFLAIVIVVSVILFFVFTGEDKYREGMEVMFEESDLTAILARDAGVMTEEQYEAWFNCVVEEGRESYPDSLIEKIEEQDFDMTPSEQGEMTTVFTRCLEEHVE